jgi:hypothetical protein
MSIGIQKYIGNKMDSDLSCLLSMCTSLWLAEAFQLCPGHKRLATIDVLEVAEFPMGHLLPIRWGTLEVDLLADWVRRSSQAAY